MKKEKPFDKTVYRSLAMVTQIGISMLVPVCLMSLLGFYLDGRFGTKFWMILLFFVGALAGGRNVYRLVLGADRESETEQRQRISGNGTDHISTKPDRPDTVTEDSAEGIAGSAKQISVSCPKKPSGWK